jgi:hypothetical protein
MKYEEIRQQWKEILKRVERVGGSVHMEIGLPATEEEVRRVEERLGRRLPASLRQTLLEFSKQVDVRWSFPHVFCPPGEFKEVTWGQVFWSLDWMADWTLNDPESEWQDKLLLSPVDNGDLIMLDLEAGEEAAVVYWNHEGGEWTRLAGSFGEYLQSLTGLLLTGSEIWHLEPFLGEAGIEPDNETARQWREWFFSFTSVDPRTLRNDPDQLIDDLLIRGPVKGGPVEWLRELDPRTVLEKCIRRMDLNDWEKTNRLCLIIGEVVGLHAVGWVRMLWDEEASLPLRREMRTWLTAKCLPEEEGLPLVLAELEAGDSRELQANASYRLRFFRSHKVIGWMKNNIQFSSEPWSSLFACSRPTWQDFREWVEMGDPHRSIAVFALDAQVRVWTDEFGYPLMDEPLRFPDPPSREEFVSLLQRVKQEEVLRRRQERIGRLIGQAGWFCRD